MTAMTVIELWGGQLHDLREFDNSAHDYEDHGVVPTPPSDGATSAPRGYRDDSCQVDQRTPVVQAESPDRAGEMSAAQERPGSGAELRCAPDEHVPCPAADRTGKEAQGERSAIH